MEEHRFSEPKALQAFYVLDVYGKQKIVKAVNDVDLAIREDEIYGIAGESGCGKTTLLKTLAAAIEPPLRVMAGRVMLSHRRRRRRCRYTQRRKKSAGCGWSISPTCRRDR